MTDRADRSRRLHARERLLATLSHEIRTPLNGVLGMAGLLAETKLDATQAAYLKALRDCGEHLLALANDVLDYAKLDAQPVKLEPTVTDVEALLQGVCELLSPRAHAGGIEIAWATRGPIPRLLADDGRLRQILFNLAGNAVKLTRRGGVLLIAEIVPGPGRGVRLRLEVADSGPGLPPDLQASIFDEFVQTEVGAAAGGAGLGLAIVRRLADAFVGQVGVESVEGEGARFWFEAGFDPAPVPPSGTASLAGVIVGVASPSAIVRTAAAAQVEASGGTARLAERAADLGPDVQVILIDPPNPAAPDRAVRALDVPALILLAPEERRQIPAARAAGYAGYLIKPLRRSSLAARITEALAPVTVAPPAPAPDDERAAAPAPIRARVLLAEDNPVNALLARTLLTHAGCTVDRAATGEEAVAAAMGTPYDLIFMDLRMPGVDGLSAARRLRAGGVATPVVALTANTFNEDRRACLDAGMNDFLTKPLDPAALRAILARWVGPAAPRATEAPIRAA